MVDDIAGLASVVWTVEAVGLTSGEAAFAGFGCLAIPDVFTIVIDPTVLTVAVVTTLPCILVPGDDVMLEDLVNSEDEFVHAGMGCLADPAGIAADMCPAVDDKGPGDLPPVTPEVLVPRDNEATPGLV